jgi:hypothetical protein
LRALASPELPSPMGVEPPFSSCPAHKLVIILAGLLAP